jgi:hypothetical protein
MYLGAKQPAKALPLIRDVLARYRRLMGPDHLLLADFQGQFGVILLGHKEFAEAERVLRDSLAIRARKQPRAWATFNARSLLGATLLGQKKYAEAEPLLLEGYEGMNKHPSSALPQARTSLIQSLERLVELYDSWERKDHAARWRKELQTKKAAPQQGEGGE